MKLLVVLSRVPYPLDKGDKLRAWYQLKELKKHHEIYLFCLDDSLQGQKHLQKLREIAHHVELYPLKKTGIILRTLPALFSSKPFQTWYFNSVKAKAKIQKAVMKFAPDHIFAQMIRTSELVKHHYNIPKTLDYMDALSKGAERRIKEEKGLRKLFWKTEWRRLLAYENLMFDYFDYKIIISEQDRDLIYHPDRKKITIVPNGVDTDFFQPIQHTPQFELVFVGNLSYLPNIQAAQTLAEEILPQLPDAKLLLSGASPTTEILSLQSDKITVTGWVDDIRNSYANGKVFVAPMQIGSGMQNKLLEAMAMGVPVITTPLAWKAIGGEDKKHLMIGYNHEEIINIVRELLSNASLYQTIAQNGRAYVKEHYSWEAQTEKLLNPD